MKTPDAQICGGPHAPVYVCEQVNEYAEKNGITVKDESMGAVTVVKKLVG